MPDLTRYLADSQTDGLTRLWWLYRFPNGRTASVIPDPSRPFHFEIRVDDEQPIVGLTTGQVEDKLTALATRTDA